MIKRIVALSAGLLLIAVLLIGNNNKTLSQADMALIKRALAVYRDLHEGKFVIRTTQSSISNGQHVLTREMTVAGQRIRWIVRIPVKVVQQKQSRRNNIVSVTAGSGAGIWYSRVLWGRLLITAGGILRDRPGIQSGLGWMF